MASLREARQTSEFWGLLGGIAAWVGHSTGWVPKDIFDHVIWPVGSYVILRATSKMARGQAPFTPLA